MPDVGIMGPVNLEVNANEVEDFGQRVDEIFIKVDKVGLVDWDKNYIFCANIFVQSAFSIYVMRLSLDLLIVNPNLGH